MQPSQDSSRLFFGSAYYPEHWLHLPDYAERMDSRYPLDAGGAF